MKLSDFMERPPRTKPLRYRAERRFGARIIYRAMKKAGKMRARDQQQKEISG